jgi:hypothetical protein
LGKVRVRVRVRVTLPLPLPLPSCQVSSRRSCARLEAGVYSAASTHRKHAPGLGLGLGLGLELRVRVRG